MKKNTNENKTNEIKETENTQKEENAGKILNSLAGNVDEVEKELEEETPTEANAFDPAAPLMKNRKAFFIVGIIIIILSIVGLVNTVKFSIDTVNGIVNQTSLKNEFADYIYPLVLIDSPAFDSADSISSSVVINSAIWRIVLSGNTDKYESDQLNYIISEIDVESSANALFGYGVKIEHQTVTNGLNAFEYNPSAKSYLVPINLDRNTYWPRVSEISNVGETFTLKVDYMSPIMGVGKEDDSDVNKQMIYTVSRTAAAMTINSLRYISEEDTQ